MSDGCIYPFKHDDTSPTLFFTNELQNGLITTYIHLKLLAYLHDWYFFKPNNTENSIWLMFLRFMLASFILKAFHGTKHLAHFIKDAQDEILLADTYNW